VTTTPAPLRLVFLGCGYITGVHSRHLRRLRALFTPGYASRDRRKADTFAARYGGRAYGDYASAIADPSVDAVVVAVPPKWHLELTVQALAAGKHVLVEKPAFPQLVDYATVRDARDRARRVVLIGENDHYKPLAVYLRRQLAAGVIGDLVFGSFTTIAHRLKTADDWRNDETMAGGDGPDRRVKSMLVAFDYDNGAVGTLLYSREVPSLFRGLRLSKLFGRRGVISFESNGTLALTRGNGLPRLACPGLRDIRGYQAMYRDFATSIHAGGAPEMSLERAAADHRLMTDVYESLARTGPPVAVRP